jgi:hypothetical protein
VLDVGEGRLDPFRQRGGRAAVGSRSPAHELSPLATLTTSDLVLVEPCLLCGGYYPGQDQGRSAARA